MITFPVKRKYLLIPYLIKEVLNKTLKQTGHVRPRKVIADKDTIKQRTRLLTSQKLKILNKQSTLITHL